MKKQNPKKTDNSNKIKLLLLWEMLNSDSDSENPLSTKEILERLEDVGVKCDRRTLYKDIMALNEFGFEVMTDLRDHSNQYYVGERGFDIPELKILMDAVTAANFISEKKTTNLHNKIAMLAGSNRAELLTKSQGATNPTKTQNEAVYFAVNEIEEAILQGKKISFLYFDLDIHGNRVLRHDGKRYIVNPVVTVFSSDYYYLRAFPSDREELLNYRIDRMQYVSIEDQPVDNPIWLKRVDLAEQKKQLFSMYGGSPVSATFEVDNSLVDVVFDKFGCKTYLKDQGDGKFRFTAVVQTSPTFFGWVLSFGDKLKVVAPTKLNQDIKCYLETVLKIY